MGGVPLPPGEADAKRRVRVNERKALVPRPAVRPGDAVHHSMDGREAFEDGERMPS